MNTNAALPVRSSLHDVNLKATKGWGIYRNKGLDSSGQTKTLCPTTGRRFVARIAVTGDGFMVTMPGGGSVQQYTWHAPKSGTTEERRAQLLDVVRHLAKRTLEVSFAGRHGDVGFLRCDMGCELPNAARAAWGYDRDNAPEGMASVACPYFDVLVAA